ncbi:MAG: winged helix-turn-helix transcriptional regulator [Lewinella sp.]|nr:winged helix-turn-helix transcriptional regulator [Lewinella sp.]
MPKRSDLDELDHQLLALLLEDGKRSYTDLAEQLYVSNGTIHVRMNKLREAGIVRGQTLLVDPSSLGYDITSFLGVYLTKSSMYEEVSRELLSIPEIVSANYTTGVYSVFIKVICRDTDHLREVLHRLQKVEGIQRTETFISLEESINRPLQLLSQEEMNELRSRKKLG